MNQTYSPTIDGLLSTETQALEPIAGPIVASMFGAQWVPVILAIIDNESGGIVGAEAHAETRYSAVLPMRAGGTKTVKKALGLMQVIPRNIEGYAQKYGPVYWEDMIGKTADAARIQIKIGCWVLRGMINSMVGYLPSMKVTAPALDPDNLGFILMAYAIGQRPVQNLIQKLKIADQSLTLANAEIMDPNLGKPRNRPFFYARKILGKVFGLAKLVKKTAQETDFTLLVAAGLTLFLILNH